MQAWLEMVLRNLDLLLRHMPTVAMVIVGLWGVQALNALSGHRLNGLGIYPRHVSGLIGILFAPILHQDAKHLMLNSVPLFILLCFISLLGTQLAVIVTLLIVVASGLGIWLFGRRGVHIGASALVMGYFGFILAFAIRTHTFLSCVIAGVCILYLGGLFNSLFPSKEGTSWEGHLMGFFAGVGAAWWLS